MAPTRPYVHFWATSDYGYRLRMHQRGRLQGHMAQKLTQKPRRMVHDKKVVSPLKSNEIFFRSGNIRKVLFSQFQGRHEIRRPHEEINRDFEQLPKLL